MSRRILSLILMVIFIASLFILTSCGKESIDYENLREVSWEGDELTITLGTNKSTGFEWTTKPEDDSVIDYSINRVFHLADASESGGEAIGSLEAGFKGQGAGTSRIICTTPVGWDGTGDGLVYIVTVTVNEDGTIESAEGAESDAAPAEETADSEMTVEKYFSEHPDVPEDIKKSFNEDEDYKGVAELDVTAKGNTLNYIYTFKETYTSEQVEALKPDLKESMDGEIAEDMKPRISVMESAFGVKGLKIYMEYRNGDGSKIYGDTIN